MSPVLEAILFMCTPRNLAFSDLALVISVFSSDSVLPPTEWGGDAWPPGPSLQFVG